MNQRLQGWQLALALIIPAMIIGAAGYIAYGALSEDDQDLATGDDDTAIEATPTATAPPQTDIVEPTEIAEPTALVVPTAAIVPTPTAGPTTATPAATSAPQPTTPPAPQPTTPPGPAPTETPDVVTIACGGTIPSSIEVGDPFGPLTATTTPADAVSALQFTWSLGDSRTVAAAQTGSISYDTPGSYTITLGASNSVNDDTASATCGTVTVTEPVVTLDVSCSVTSVLGIPVDDARAGDNMRVTVSWTPSDIPLYLQYEFEATDDLIIVNPASSGNSQENGFSTNGGVFRIFWRYDETGETGRVSCPAYPGADTGTGPTPTAIPTPFATPTPTGTVVGTPTPTPTGTVVGTPTPTPTPTVDNTPTPTPTVTVDPTPTPTPTATP